MLLKAIPFVQSVKWKILSRKSAYANKIALNNFFSIFLL